MDGLEGGTLADEFLLDFEEDEVKTEEKEEEEGDAGVEQQEEDVVPMDVSVDGVAHVSKVSNLRSTQTFTDLMRDIERAKQVTTVTLVSTRNDFELITRSNDLISDIIIHQNRVSKFIKDLYAERFPELESLLPDVKEYVRTVRCLGNETDITKVELDKVLPGHTAMIVRIGASTTTGSPMSAERMKSTLEGCDEYDQLEAARESILQYIESRMVYVAPNMSHLVGTHIAAKLVSAAGGLDKLSCMSANAVRVLGVQKKTLGGLSAATQIKHVGYLQECQILKDCPVDVRKQATRVLAGKVTLAARVDAQGARQGVVTVGAELKEEVMSQMSRLVAPPPPRQLKALPVPHTGAEGKSTKRGGELARKKKAQSKMTELGKQQKRLAFGEIKDEGINDIMGADLGLVGSTMGTGKVKVSVEDTGILKGLSKKRKMEIARALEPMQGTRSNFGRASHIALGSGMKSSLALEGDRGIELVEAKNPANDKPKPTTKYFGTATSFAVPAPVVKK